MTSAAVVTGPPSCRTAVTKAAGTTTPESSSVPSMSQTSCTTCSLPGTRRQRRPSPRRAGGRIRRPDGRPVLQCLQSEPDGGLQLSVTARGPVIRRGNDLDIGVDAVVLDSPAVRAEPEGQPRHGHRGAVDQLVRLVIADDAAPGPRADHRAEPEDLDRRRDDVAVRTRTLVSKRD